MEIKVYTAITGGYEPDRNDITVCNFGYQFGSERLNAKIYKCLPHLFFTEAITIWLDGNIRFASDIDLEKFVEDFLCPISLPLALKCR